MSFLEECNESTEEIRERKYKEIKNAVEKNECFGECCHGVEKVLFLIKEIERLRDEQRKQKNYIL